MEQMGVSPVSIPNYATRDPARRSRQKQRWFKRGQKWRTGVEGRISVLKRRHGLDRSRYPGAGRHAALGGAGSDRRQPDQHRGQPGGEGDELSTEGRKAKSNGNSARIDAAIIDPDRLSIQFTFLRRKVSRGA